MDSMFKAFDISASGLTAQRLRMDTISENVANVNTTRTAAGGPYRRKTVVLETRGPETNFPEILNQSLESQKVGNGVRVAKIVEDQSPFKLIYDPDHPDADADGYVRMPNVNIVSEMVNMISASRAYEANTTVIKATKDMILKALEIGR